MSSRFRRSAYPPHWPALRQAVLARAAYACECQGECGSVHPQGRCAVPHLACVVRDPDVPARWRVVERPARGTIRIVLAVAHLCQDRTCADLACLRGLCQRCHLRYDHAQQWRTRRRNHRAALEGAGQLCLWPAAAGQGRRNGQEDKEWDTHKIHLSRLRVERLGKGGSHAALRGMRAEAAVGRERGGSIAVFAARLITAGEAGCA